MTTEEKLEITKEALKECMEVLSFTRIDIPKDGTPVQVSHARERIAEFLSAKKSGQKALRL